MGEWRPIETAPKDGRSFLAVDYFGIIERCRFIDNEIVLSWNHDLFCGGNDMGAATHWMPLPEPPKDSP